MPTLENQDELRAVFEKYRAMCDKLNEECNALVQKNLELKLKLAILSPGWIDCKDRLPNDGDRVLCFEDFTQIGKEYQGVETYYFRKGMGFVHRLTDDDPYGMITHWALYEPPTKECYGTV